MTKQMSMQRRSLAVMLCTLIFAPYMAFAEVRLPSCFSDNMVLQREMPVAVWGTAQPGERVSVAFREQVQSAVADAEGDWNLHLDSLELGPPGQLTVTASNTIQLENVLVGEVWLGSGQSNMAYSVGSDLFVEDTRLGTMFQEAPYPEIRLLHYNGTWTQATPQTVEAFSALLFSFGAQLQSELDVPIGLIQAARGSTPSGGWLTPAMLETDAACRKQVEAFKAENPPEVLQAKYEDAMQKWRKQAAKKAAAGQNPPPEPSVLVPGDFQGRRLFNLFPVGAFYRERVEPLAGYTLRAILWDQGESGTGLDELDQYLVMGALARGWRQAWDRDSLPFLYVQKPSGAGCAWDYENPVTSMARPFEVLDPDARMKSTWGVGESYFQMMDYPNTWMVPTSDLGPGLHPINKSGYGERAAHVALNSVYGREIPAMGPNFKSATVEGSHVRIQFNHVNGGLFARHGDRLQGFVLKDAVTQNKHWAQARIEGDSVLLSSLEVAEPAEVSYAWAKEYAWANLFNGHGMAALPFCHQITSKP